MPVMQCAGTRGCGRLISVSAVPGGNPAAKADPEGFASEWALCSCGRYTCDRCLRGQQGRCGCGQPARLLSEPERIQVATDMMQGRKPKAPPPPAAPAPSAAAGGGAQFALGGGAQLQSTFEALGQQIDGELSRGNQPRAQALAVLAGSLMGSQGQEAPAQAVQWLMRWGEQFYRWKFFAEGGEYWKGVYQLINRLGGADSDFGTRAVVIAGAFQILGGLLPANGDPARKVLELGKATLGADHILMKDVAAKVNAAGSGGGWSTAGANPGPFGGGGGGGGGPFGGGGAGAKPPSAGPFGGAAPAGAAGGAGAIGVNMKPQPKAPSSAIANLNGSEKLSLWVTLAFLDIAASDGKVGDDEYLVWKRSIQQMQLPDLWDRFGTQGLVNLVRNGTLQELSAEFSSLPGESRVKMAGILRDFVMADGKAEDRELQAMSRILSWLGLSMKIG